MMEVKVCMQEIVKLDLDIKARIQDIREYDGPLEYLNDLNIEVQNKIQTLRERLSDLEQLANEQDKETDRQAILRDAEAHRTQLASTQTSLRKANLASQMNIDRKQTDMLLRGGSDLRQRTKINKEGMVKGTSSITDNLMNISRMMASEVTRSQQTVNTLANSSGQLGETNEELKSMTGHIQSSRKLLTKYGRRECTDKLLIFLALVFFFATVLYIVKKRLFPA